jgi:hypothetical protein
MEIIVNKLSHCRCKTNNRNRQPVCLSLLSEKQKHAQLEDVRCVIKEWKTLRSRIKAVDAESRYDRSRNGRPNTVSMFIKTNKQNIKTVKAKYFRVV